MDKKRSKLRYAMQHLFQCQARWGLVASLFGTMLAFTLGTSSCANKVFYTQEYRVLVDSAHIDPTRLQFYNDKEFLIRNKSVKKEVVTEEGVVNQTEGARVSDLRIRRGTPCRVDSVSGNNYWVRFEIGDSCVIRFYKNAYDHYQIGADLWVAGRGKIRYGGKDYVIERMGNDCLLQVKNYQQFRDQMKRSRAGGIRVGEEGSEIRDSVEVDDLDFEE